MLKLSTKPLKGFRDFTPEDWKIQRYIFDNWKNVCEKYGYVEYSGPILEPVEIYNKSGDDVGEQGKELYVFDDRGGRKIVLRPEMTPTVGRLIAENAKKYTKPIRWYSIAQFFRAENPQRGRGREFYQLNFDLFGSESVYADLEILQMAIDIMKSFGADSKMFTLKINDRRLLNEILNQVVDDQNTRTKILRKIDAYKKKPEGWLEKELSELGLDEKQVSFIRSYLGVSLAKVKDFIKDTKLTGEIQDLFALLKKSGYGEYCVFDPSLARGFDYYNGMVFEVFDNNPQNNRSMFGGGRYDTLVDMFSNESVPAVGCAPGDITLKLFLESWNLLQSLPDSPQKRYYIPMLNSDSYSFIVRLANELREQYNIVTIGLQEENLNKALSYANKMKFDYVVIMGQDEIKGKAYKIKNMRDGSEKLVSI